MRWPRRRAPEPDGDEGTGKKRNRRVRPRGGPARSDDDTLDEAAPPSWRDRLAGTRAAVGAFGARLRRPVELALRALVVIAVGVGAVALGRLVERHVRTSPAFGVTQIDLEGHVRLTEDEVLQVAGLSMGQNVFDVAPEEAERRLAEHPWIAEATVRRRLPGTYRVEVRERRAVALLAVGDVFLVSEDGAVFKRVEDDDPVDLPVITGVDRERFTRDRGFRTSVLLEVVALLSDYQGAGMARREPISEVHVENDDGLSLYVGEDAMFVRLGHGPFREKLSRLRTVLDELSSRGARAAYVYLDNERRPDRVTVRVLEPEDAPIEPVAPPEGAASGA